MVVVDRSVDVKHLETLELMFVGTMINAEFDFVPLVMGFVGLE